MVSAQTLEELKATLDGIIGLTSQMVSEGSAGRRQLVYSTPTGMKLFSLFLLQERNHWICEGEGEVANPLTELANRVATLSRDTVEDE